MGTSFSCQASAAWSKDATQGSLVWTSKEASLQKQMHLLMDSKLRQVVKDADRGIHIL
jgi:hypothetical protein